MNVELNQALPTKASWLRWSLGVFPGGQDSYDLSERHHLYGLARYVFPNHTDHAIYSNHSF